MTELKNDASGHGGSSDSAATPSKGYPRVEQATTPRKTSVMWQSQTPSRTASFSDRRASESMMGSGAKPSTPQLASPASGSSVANTTSPRQVVFQLQASPKLGGQVPASAPARSTNHPNMRQQAPNYPPILAQSPPMTSPIMRPIAMQPTTTMPRREEVAPWLAAVAATSPTTSPRTAPAALPFFPPNVTERRSSRMVASAPDGSKERDEIQRYPRSAAAAGRRKEEANLVKGDLLEILALWPEHATEDRLKAKMALACCMNSFCQCNDLSADLLSSGATSPIDLAVREE